MHLKWVNDVTVKRSRETEIDNRFSASLSTVVKRRSVATNTNWTLTEMTRARARIRREIRGDDRSAVDVWRDQTGLAARAVIVAVRGRRDLRNLCVT